MTVPSLLLAIEPNPRKKNHALDITGHHLGASSFIIRYLVLDLHF
jgi:hypothetical protein